MAQEAYTSHNPPFAVHSNHVCGKMNMGSHECIWLQLVGHQGRKLLEIHITYIYIYIYIHIYTYIYIRTYIYVHLLVTEFAAKKVKNRLPSSQLQAPALVWPKVFNSQVTSWQRSYPQDPGHQQHPTATATRLCLQILGLPGDEVTRSDNGLEDIRK